MWHRIRLGGGAFEAAAEQDNFLCRMKDWVVNSGYASGESGRKFIRTGMPTTSCGAYSLSCHEVGLAALTVSESVVVLLGEDMRKEVGDPLLALLRHAQVPQAVADIR